MAFLWKKRGETIIQSMESSPEFIEITLRNEKYVFLYPINENYQPPFGIKNHTQGGYSCTFPKGNYE